MKSGLRFKDNNLHRRLGAANPRPRYFQKLFEMTDPITPARKEYKYTGIDLSMIVLIIDIKTQPAYGSSQQFIA